MENIGENDCAYVVAIDMLEGWKAINSITNCGVNLAPKIAETLVEKQINIKPAINQIRENAIKANS